MAIRPWADDQAVDEPGAGGVDVEGAAAQAELVLHRRGRGRHCVSGVVVASTSTSISARSTPDMSSAGAARLDRQADGGAADVALVDAGALDDPLVGRVDHLLEVVVGERSCAAGPCPNPVITAPRTPEGSAGMSDRPQPGDGLAHRDSFAVDGDVALQDAGERRAHLGVADVAEHVADRQIGCRRRGRRSA